MRPQFCYPREQVTSSYIQGFFIYILFKESPLWGVAEIDSKQNQPRFS